MALLTVTKENGTVVALPDPQSLQWQIQDVDADGTGRNQNGELFRDRVAIKRKIVCSWMPMGVSEASVLLSAVEDQFFTLAYPDAKTGASRSMTCYVGDRTAPALRLAANGDWLWGNIAFNFIEK